MLIGELKVPGSRGFNIGFDLAVALSMEMPTDDLSGSTSLTDRADNGVKPKRVSVAFSLRENKAELAYWTKILAMLEARDSSDQALEYVVIHPLIQASRIRKMRTVGTVRVTEHQTMLQYDVQFELEEVKSVPEVAETRKGDTTNTDNSSTESSSAVVTSADNFKTALEKIEAQAKTA